MVAVTKAYTLMQNMHHRLPNLVEMKLPIITPVRFVSAALSGTTRTRVSIVGRTKEKSQVNQAVEEREPVWLEEPFLAIENAKSFVECVHGLGSGIRLVIKPIVEGRNGNQRASQEKPQVEA